MPPRQEKPTEDDWDGEDRRTNRGNWHLKKEITYGQILTTVTMLCAGVVYIIGNERAHERHAIRIDQQERMIQRLEQNDRDADGKLNSAVGRIEIMVQRADDKLNRLIEKASR